MNQNHVLTFHRLFQCFEIHRPLRYHVCKRLQISLDEIAAESLLNQLNASKTISEIPTPMFSWFEL